MYISTNDPAKSLYVCQFMGGSSRTASTGLNFIPPLSRFFQQSVNLIPRFDEITPSDPANYQGNVLITAFTGTIVTVNGTNLPIANALPNPGTPDWGSYLVPNLSGNVIVTGDGPIAVGVIGFDVTNNGAPAAAGFAGYYSGFSVFPEDTNTEICSDGGPINLVNRINGNATAGGTWVPALAGGGDIFDPLTDPLLNPSLTYTYQVAVSCDFIDVEVIVNLVENPTFEFFDTTGCDSFVLPDPATLIGTNINNPQYFTGLQTDVSSTLIDWNTAVFTVDTTIYLYDNNPANPFDCDTEIPINIDITEIPTANPVPQQIICDDASNDGTEAFDLSALQATIVGTQTAADLSITFHNSQTDATTNTNAITPTTAVVINDGDSIFARIENNNNTNCFDTTEIIFTVDKTVIPSTFELNYAQCDDGGDGLETFNFSNATALIADLFSPSQITNIAYYETEAEALNQTNPILNINAYENIAALTDINGVQIIWIRVDAASPSTCFYVGTHINLNINPNPDLNTGVTDLIACSPVANFFTFDLTQKDIEITGGNPDIVVSYYESLEAYNSQNQINTPSTYTNITNPQTIFYSAENTITGCVTFDPDTAVTPDFSFELVINQSPIIFAPTALEVCDNNGLDDGFTIINLTEKNVEITGGFDPELVVSYHLDLSGAEANDTSIPDPTAFLNTTNPQIVIARVERTDTGCFSTVNLPIEIIPSMIATVPAPYEECDQDNDGIFDFFVLSSGDMEIIGGNTTLTVQYYLTEEDANNAPVGLELDNMMYINNEPFMQIVWARVSNSIGCFDVVPLELIILNTPMPNEMPNTFEVCDDNADGAALFDLTSQEAQILYGLDPAVYNVTWFNNQTSADAGFPVITNPMAYTSNSNTVIALVTDTTQSATTFCSTSVALALTVNPLPLPIQPAAFEACDDEESGSNIDEFTTFDLRSKDDEITGGNNNWSVSYHLTEIEANAGTPALVDAYQNTTMANQTIWVRVQNIVTGCYNLTTMTLVVNPLPSPSLIPDVVECDDNGDGQAIFDLSTAVTTAIIDGETFVTLSFHETPEAAELGTPSIMDATAYQSASKTLWVRATDTDPSTETECFRVIQIELVVVASPILPTMIPDITVCDQDENGQELVDITINEAIILGNQNAPAFNLSYHETLVSATAEVNSVNDMPIADPENYLITATSTTIFLRLENAISGCTNTEEFDILIAPQPTFTVPPTNLEACDSAGGVLGTDTDGVTSFDLTTLSNVITAGDPNITINYYESLEDLNADSTIAQTDAFINTTNPQTIFIQISSSLEGICTAQASINLVVNPLPVLPEPLMSITTCDDDNDGFAAFDLQAYATTLLVNLTNIDLRFYETLDNAQADTGAGQIDISIPYNNNTVMTQLFIVAQGNDPATSGACSKIFPVDLLIFTRPEITEDLPTISLCDTDNDGEEFFDLTQNEIFIYGMQDPANFSITYHNDQASAEDTTPQDAPYTPIAVTSNYASTGTITAPETIWVRLETTNSSESTCFAVSSFELIVAPLPVINPTGEDLNQSQCNDGDEIVTFDLTLNQDFITNGDNS